MIPGELELLLEKYYSLRTVINLDNGAVPHHISSRKILLSGEYLVEKNITIGKSGSLVLEEGVRLSFTPGVSICVEGGALYSRGKKENPVVLEGVVDDFDRSGWGGISFDGGIGNFKNTILSGVGSVPARLGFSKKNGEPTSELYSSGTSAEAVILASNAKLQFKNVSVRDNETKRGAFLIIDSSLVVNGSFFRRNVIVNPTYNGSWNPFFYGNPSVGSVKKMGGDKVLAAAINCINSEGSINTTLFKFNKGGKKYVGAVSLLNAPVAITNSSFGRNEGYLSGALYVNTPHTDQIVFDNGFSRNIGYVGGAVHVAPDDQLKFGNYVHRNNSFDKNASRNKKHPDVFYVYAGDKR